MHGSLRSGHPARTCPSPALPGSTANLTAARTYRTVVVCEQFGIAVLADKGYVVGGTLENPIRRAMSAAAAILILTVYS